jgi:hypothetical protein
MNTTNFFMMACTHFFCNYFFIDETKISYQDVMSEDVHNALRNGTLALENGMMLYPADEYEDMPVEILLSNILTLAEDFQRMYECGRGDERSELNKPMTINHTVAENSIPTY